VPLGANSQGLPTQQQEPAMDIPTTEAARLANQMQDNTSSNSSKGEFNLQQQQAQEECKHRLRPCKPRSG